MIKLVNRLKLIFYATNIAYFSQTTKFGCLKNQSRQENHTICSFFYVLTPFSKLLYRSFLTQLSQMGMFREVTGELN